MRERAAHPCIGPGRADLVIAGCAILEAILRSWPTDQLRVADRGLREGMLQAMIGRSLEQALSGPGATVTVAGPAAPRSGVATILLSHGGAARDQGPPALGQGSAGELEPLARAPHQRPFRAERARPGLPVARRLQAARDRSEVRSSAAGPAGHRPRQRARRLGPGRRGARLPGDRRRPRGDRADRRRQAAAGRHLRGGDGGPTASAGRRTGRARAERSRRRPRPVSARSIGCAPKAWRRRCWRCCRSSWRRAAARS